MAGVAAPGGFVSGERKDRTGVEDRRHQRFRIKVPVYISLGEETYRKSVHLESRDVSGGGLSFETRRRIPLDSDSRVIIARLGDLADPIMIHGRVAYRQKNPETGRYVVGVQFTRFVNTTREELLERLYVWQGATPPPRS
jgi:c-di-GMP-binding flagellar brake protein YcgR